MKTVRMLSLVAALVPGVAIAADIDTALFSLEVPDSWQVEDNQRNTVLAMGSRARDGMPSPLLSVQFCAASRSAKYPEQALCARSCEAEALAASNPVETAEIALVNRLQQKTDVTESAVAAPQAGAHSSLQALACSGSGQVHFGFVSEEAPAVARQQFEKIVKSLKWK